jgi:hypothetical protein
MALIDTLREPKIAGFVIFDYAATFLSAVILSYTFNIEYLSVLVVLLLLSIILHIVFNIPTETNYYLGLSSKPIRK